MTLFYPLNLSLPVELHHPRFYLRPLLTSDAEMDYDAVIASRAALLVYSLGRWPHENFTLDENRTDLQRHEREHIARERFTFTVLNPDASQCLGCVYIKPLNSLLEQSLTRVTKASSLAARVTFWLRPECLSADLDSELLATLRVWLRDSWVLDKITFMANENETRRLRIFHEADLRVQYTLNFSSTSVVFYLYG